MLRLPCKVWLTPLAMPGALTALAMLDRPGLIAAGPGDALFVTSPAQLYEVSATGQVSSFIADRPTSAVAYDPDHKRVFAFENLDGDAGTGGVLLIRPVD